MKIAKHLALLGILTIAVLAASGCTARADSPSSSSSAGGRPVTAAESSSGRKVVFTVEGDALLRESFSTIGEMSRSDAVRTIVRGKVTATDDVYSEGIANRILTVDVTKKYKGESPATIRVYEDGGYVRLKDMLPDLSARGQTSTFTPQQIEEGIVDVVFMGAEHSQVGDVVVLFLRENPNPSQGDSYQLVSAVQGRLTLNKKNGQYERPSGREAAPGFQGTIGTVDLENELAKAR